MFGESEFKTYYRNGFQYLKISNGKSKSSDLIFLHGLFGGLSNYDPLIKLLQGYNIFVPSIPVYDFDTSELTISRLTQWFHSFYTSLEISNPVLLGNSMGGHVALDYVLQYPDNVRALVLTGSSGLQERDFGSTFPRRNDRDFIRKQAGKTFYEDLIDDVILDEIMDVIKSPSKLTNLLALTRDTHKYNMEDHLSKIKQDVLLIWGKNDEITPPEVARTFQNKLPNAKLRWIDKCGHAPMMEHPQTFALYLNEFLIELERQNDQTTIEL
jgi:pimeloyl-ACP methyl ester carboxylesterase